jgi:hypothetical protein
VDPVAVVLMVMQLSREGHSSMQAVTDGKITPLGFFTSRLHQSYTKARACSNAHALCSLLMRA